MENVTTFRRDPAERAILRTEITEGMAIGSGCANVQMLQPVLVTAKQLVHCL